MVSRGLLPTKCIILFKKHPKNPIKIWFYEQKNSTCHAEKTKGFGDQVTLIAFYDQMLPKFFMTKNN
jgi:hypothetical protein